MPDREPIQLVDPEIPIEDCDICLGTFIRAWDQLELALFQLFHKLLDTDVATATILFHAGINLGTIRVILAELGKHRLKADPAKKLEALIRRVKNAATKRNRVVHGHWMLMVHMGSRPHPKPLKAQTVEWIRRYHPPDSKALRELNRRTKQARSAYEFEPERLLAAARDVSALAREINQFRKAQTLQPVSDPQPVEW